MAVNLTATISEGQHIAASVESQRSLDAEMAREPSLGMTTGGNARLSVSVTQQPVLSAVSDAVNAGGSGYLDDYNLLRNKPSIEGTVLVGNRTLPEIGVEELTAAQVAALLD